MKLTSIPDFAAEAKKMDKKSIFAVVEASDDHTLESVIHAYAEGIMIPRLIGNSGKIKGMLADFGADPADYDVVPANSAAESLRIAVGMINSGEATAIMKGNLESADFLRAIVKKENGMLRGTHLSLAVLFSLPRYHKIFAVSDVGLNTYPDMKGKKAIIENSVRMLNALGIENPKVAVLAAIEKINPKMPETLDADALKKMNRRGEIKNCIVEGPISFDLATSAEAARIKGYDSPVAGDADLLVVPEVVSGNILVKCLTGMAGALTAGTVLGSKVPIMFTSRSSEASDKYYSIALTACVAAGALDRI